jgi:ribosomal protein S18 acetylase RimI-like enzyme
MNDVIHVSIADRKDAGMIADLSRKTFYDTFAPHNSPENMELFMTTQFTRKQLIVQVGAPGNTFLVARINDEPVGYVRLFEGAALPKELEGVNVIEIARIYAVQPVIGKGVGKALMQASLDLSRQKGKEWIWLGVWEHNHRAIAFYEKMGFEIFERHIFLLGQDVQYDWSMKRKL